MEYDHRCTTSGVRDSPQPEQTLRMRRVRPRNDDTRYRELRDAPASVYFSLAQLLFGFASATLVIRTARCAAQRLRRVARTCHPPLGAEQSSRAQGR
jgi:hypothetical protein